MAAILFVRITSELDLAELERRALDRKPLFLEVPGLIQKIYGKDPATGEVCGIYFFEDEESLAAYKESELAKTIPSAYEASEVRREVYDLLFSLKPKQGPFSD